jgi:hypothetical protein
MFRGKIRGSLPGLKLELTMNSQNAVGEKDFIALEKDFRNWAPLFNERYGVFLEIQRGAWEARRFIKSNIAYLYEVFMTTYCDQIGSGLRPRRFHHHSKSLFAQKKRHSPSR